MKIRQGFGGVPYVRFNRTKFFTPHRIQTTTSVGRLFPIRSLFCYPGENYSAEDVAVSNVSSSFIKPVTDNLELVQQTYFVPLRLITNSWDKIFGNPTPSSYQSSQLYKVPHTLAAASVVYPKSVGDYLGLPISLGTTSDNTSTLPSISLLDFRAFAKVWNDWHRNENVQDEVFINKDDPADGHTNIRLNGDEWSAVNYTGMCPRVLKKRDYFTDCLPSSQKGAPVRLSLGAYADVINKTPAGELGEDHKFQLRRADGDGLFGYKDGARNPMILYGVPSTAEDASFRQVYAQPLTGNTNIPTDNPAFHSLQADLSTATSTDVNTLRLAFALQKMLETDSIYGSRYSEYCYGHFGLSSDSISEQFSQFVGGSSTPIRIQRVAQTSVGTEDSPLANVAGFSESAGSCKWSFFCKEHGILITVGYIRQSMHTYQQGLDRKWLRLSREQFYDPMFAHLGQQPVYTYELDAGYLRSDVTPDYDTVFGYQEAWADLRNIPSRITGEMRSTSAAGRNSFDIWHFGDYYTGNRPTLSKEFLEETPDYVDRTLSVSSDTADSFLIDFASNMTKVSVMPLYSIPGLIDHR